MCTYSMVVDHYKDLWSKPNSPSYVHPIYVGPYSPPLAPHVSKEEFETLKRQVEEMKELLKRAKEYDRRNNEPDCETAEKVEVVRKIAEMVGIKLDDVLGDH